MPTQLARRLDAVQPSATLALAARATALRAAGHTIYPFGVGEPDFDTAVDIRDAAKRALDAGQTRYTPVSGMIELRRAIAARSAQTRAVACTAEQVVVSVGAKHALFNLSLALYEPGDEVVIPAPYWVSYPEQVRMMGATPVIVETHEADGWLLTPQALQSTLTGRTKAIVLCTPCNPTGGAYDERAIAALVEVVARHDCWLVVDEIYAALVYDQFRHVSALTVASASVRERIIVVDGLSKSHAMTGWRIGWSIAPLHLARALDLVQGQSTTNASSISQVAAIQALQGSQGSMETMRAAYELRRTLMVEALRAIPGIRCRVPEGALYVFADVRALYGIKSIHGKHGVLEDDVDVANFMLEEAGCAAVPGSAFGGPGYMRFSYAASGEAIDKGLARLRAAVERAR